MDLEELKEFVIISGDVANLIWPKGNFASSASLFKLVGSRYCLDDIFEGYKLIQGNANFSFDYGVYKIVFYSTTNYDSPSPNVYFAFHKNGLQVIDIKEFNECLMKCNAKAMSIKSAGNLSEEYSYDILQRFSNYKGE